MNQSNDCRISRTEFDCFNLIWNILTGSCRISHKVVNFLGTPDQKCCGIDQMNSSTLPYELISIYKNDFIGAAVNCEVLPED